LAKATTGFRYEPDGQGIITGNVGALERRLQDGSVDLILADPPYDRGHLDVYAQIAELAVRKLKPGHLCLAYTGKLFLDRVFTAMSRHLTYWWLFVVTLRGRPQAGVSSRRIEEGYRPVVAFARPPLRPAPAYLAELIPGCGREKDLHDWQQAQGEAEYFVERLTKPGELVVDPCYGSGTVPAAAKATGRRWLAAEVDPDTAALARARLAEG
jgi:site-specific DNA-methyltransferase (adenine-specific)